VAGRNSVPESGRSDLLYDDMMRMGRKMNIDLGSWEARLRGRPAWTFSQCAVGLDQVSYLSGFCQGRAWRKESRTRAHSSSIAERVRMSHRKGEVTGT